MDEISSRANVAKGTIYYHFKSKEELFVFLVEEGTQLLRESVLARIDRDAAPAEQLAALVRAQLSFFKDYRDFCIIFLREAWGEEQRQRDFRRMLVHYVRDIQTIIEAGRDAGEFAALHPETTAWAIFGAVSTTAIHYLFVNREYDLQMLAPQLEQMVLSGIVGKRKSPSPNETGAFH